MTNETGDGRLTTARGGTGPLRFLKPREIVMIDDALAALGQFGELRLVVERGRLRYLVTQRSLDALKWRPGAGTEDLDPIG